MRSGTPGVRPVRLQVPRSEPRLDLQEVLSVLWFRKWSILAITLLTVAVALLVSSRQTPIYESQASVFVTPIDTGAESVPPEDPNLATEAELVSSVAVAEIVAENLGIEGDPRDLLANLEVDQPTDTEILEVSYRDPVPVQARRLAMGFAEGYLQFREAAASKLILERAEDLEAQIQVLEQRLRTIRADLVRIPDNDPRRVSLEAEAASLQNLILQTQITRLGLPSDVTGGQVIQPASVPRSPVSPDHVVNGAFGLAAGLALGIGLALLRDRMSGRLRSSEEVEEYLEAPVLGVVPRVPDWRRSKRAYLVERRALAVTRRGGVSRPSDQPALDGLGRSQEHRRDQHAQRGGQVRDGREPRGRPREGRQERDARLRGSAAAAPPRVLPARRAGRAQRRPGRPAAPGCRRSGGHSSGHPPPWICRRSRYGSWRAGPCPRIRRSSWDPSAMAKVLEDLEGVSDIVLIDVPPILPGDGCSGRCRQSKGRAPRDRTEQRHACIRRVGSATARTGGGPDPRWRSERAQRHQGAILRLLLMGRSGCRPRGPERSSW